MGGQAIIVALASLLALVFFGAGFAVSVAVGGLSAVIPNGLFAIKTALAVWSNAAKPTSFFVGELIKLAATIGLFYAALRGWPELSKPGLILGLTVAVVGFVFAPLWLSMKWFRG